MFTLWLSICMYMYKTEKEFLKMMLTFTMLDGLYFLFYFKLYFIYFKDAGGNIRVIPSNELHHNIWTTICYHMGYFTRAYSVVQKVLLLKLFLQILYVLLLFIMIAEHIIKESQFSIFQI